MIPAFPRRAVALVTPLAALSLTYLTTLSAAPIISEFCPDNATLIADSDGDFSDWIEVHNPDAAPVDLGGYALTDSAAEPQKWVFPAGTTLAAGEFLTVFASDKDRDTAGAELHTNFKLSAGGEYLALVAPDSSVLQEFAPEYPPLEEDESYGVVFDGSAFVVEGATAQTLVPADGSLGTGWIAPGFSPGASWISGTTGAGFGVDIPGIFVRQIFSTGEVRNLGAADSLIAGNNIERETSVIAPMINYLDTEANGSFDNDVPFPGGGGDRFVIYVTGTITIPTAGSWTFASNTDDGSRLRIDGTDVLVDNTRHGPINMFATANLSAGPHTLEYVMFESGGGAQAELSAAPGNLSSFSNAFRLIGDTENGGLEVRTSAQGGATGGFIGTDLTASMKDQRTSAYLRIPFAVADPSAVTSLSLRMRYSDGFVAYINGTEVASANAPSPAAWNSVATGQRTDPLFQEAFGIASFSSLLTSGGNNVLAIHGLSSSVSDDEFIILPELIGGGLLAGSPVVFESPTPGSINDGSTSLGSVLDTKFDPDRGFYPNSTTVSLPFDVTISTSTPDASIYFTTDGSQPSSSNGTLYIAPISITGTTTLRAIATKPGFLPTDIDTHTYLVLDDIITQSESPPAGWPSEENQDDEIRVNDQIFDYGMDPEIVNNGNPEIGGVAKVKEALQSIPTLSINLPLESLIDPSDGIYVNAEERGFQWEREASLELIYPENYISPDGQTDGFQIGCGLRVRGNFSRNGDNPKHSFRLFFRGQYGDTKLRYPMFGDEGADEFDGIDLRGAQNYAWAFSYDSRNSFLRDIWARDIQGAIGQPYTRSRYYHLYLNGIYWGMCMTQERAEADYAETYFGGDEEDYDVVKSFGNSTDGNLDAYERLFNKWRAGFTSDAAYYDILGRNPSGQFDPANHEQLIDLDNLIDYMIINYYSGDRDGPGSRFTGTRPNNYFGIFNRTDPKGFAFFEHDSEHSLGTGADNMVSPFKATIRNNNTAPIFADFNPHILHQTLAEENALYRAAFADRLEKHLAPGAPLHEDRALEILDARAARIDTPIIAHSARWGDSKRDASTSPRTRTTWLGAVEDIRDFLRGRESKLKSQLRSVGWIPDVDAPDFVQHGGYLASDEALLLGGTSGTIYVTANGDDPRNEDGSVDSDANIFTGATSPVTFVSAGSDWKFLDSITSSVPGWQDPGFADGSWSTDSAPLGYGDDGLSPVGFVTNGGNKNISTYFRHTFDAGNISNLTELTLGLRRDDGAVVYLNGEEIARSNMPGGTITFSTPASGGVGGSDEEAFQQISLDLADLDSGQNVIAVEIHQVSGTSSDIAFDLQLSGERASAATSAFLSGPGEVQVKTRALEAGEWSPLNQALFFVDLVSASSANLQVSELSYRPGAPTTAEIAAGFDSRDDFEFIELTNTSADHVHLRGLAFTEGIGFVFDDDSASVFVVAPGERVVLVSNEAAFRARYGAGPVVAGEFRGGLSNGGEIITLGNVASFTYDDVDPWPTNPDGAGDTLTYTGSGDQSDAANWTASSIPGGTPGASDGLTYASWKASLGITAADDSDDDRDGIPLFSEYALGGDPASYDANRELTMIPVAGDMMELSIPYRVAAGDIAYGLESSPSLTAFQDTGVAPVFSNGRARFVIPAQVQGIDREFFRVRFSAP